MKQEPRVPSAAILGQHVSAVGSLDQNPSAPPPVGDEISMPGSVTAERSTDCAVRVTSTVVFVSDLSRSVGFYRDLFACEVTIESDSAALLLAPGGFQIYLIASGSRTPHPSRGIGLQYLIWAVESTSDLDDLERAVLTRGGRAYRHTSGDITYLTCRDPDGIRVVVAHPSPEKLPRVLVDNRLYA
jgi:hypothetical protein